MIITQGKLAFDYILPSKLRVDVRHWRSFPLGATSRWTPAQVMKKLVDAGLAKVCTTAKDGSISEIFADNLTVEAVEAACLTEEDHKRIDAWLAKGVVK